MDQYLRDENSVQRKTTTRRCHCSETHAQHPLKLIIFDMQYGSIVLSLHVIEYTRVRILSPQVVW